MGPGLGRPKRGENELMRYLLNQLKNPIVFLLAACCILLFFAFVFQTARSNPNLITLPKSPPNYLALRTPEDVLKLSFDNLVQDKEDLESWKEELRIKVTSLLRLELNPPVPDYVMLSSVRKEGYDLIHIQYERIPGYILVPHDVNYPVPGVLILAGHGHGAGTLIGEQEEVLYADGQVDIGQYLAQEGYVVLVPELDTLGSRATDLASGIHTGTHARYGTLLSMLGYSSLGIQAQEALTSAELLKSLDWVRDLPIGVIGLSTGSHLSFIVAALDPEIKVAHSASGVLSTIHLQEWLTTPEYIHDQIPGLLEWADQPDVAGLISPRPFLMTYGNQEGKPFSIEAKRKYSYNYIKAIYEMDQAEGNLVFKTHEGGHQYSKEIVKDFLDEYLR